MYVLKFLSDQMSLKNMFTLQEYLLLAGVYMIIMKR